MKRKRNMDSIMSVNKYMHAHNIEQGQPFQAKISVQIAHKPDLDDTAEVYIFYDVGYAQFRIEIEWSFGDNIMYALGLRGSYNTNFQTFEVDGAALIIQDTKSKIRICISKQKDGQR